MRGLLIYDEEGAKRNAWFIDRLIECASEEGHNLKLEIVDPRSENIPSTLPDFVIMRAICPRLTEKYEEAGVRVFNNSITSRVANDKWESYLHAKELDIPVMESALVTSPSEAMEKFPFPFVLKCVDGHGGNEVFWVNNPDFCKELFSKYQDRKLIAQEPCSECGIDMRVYLLGGKVFCTVKRTSSSDFRSNFSLGGNATLTELGKDEMESVNKIYDSLKCDFVGVDFIRHNGRWVLNEIEDVVGTRMIYSLTDLDPANEYLKYIFSTL